MDAVLFGGGPIQNKGTTTSRVVEYARRFYEGEVADALLRDWAKDAVDQVWGDGPRVTKYVPMLALREVRRRVVERLEAQLAAGEPLPQAAARDIWVWQTQHKQKVRTLPPANGPVDVLPLLSDDGLHMDRDAMRLDERDIVPL